MKKPVENSSSMHSFITSGAKVWQAKHDRSSMSFKSYIEFQ